MMELWSSLISIKYRRKYNESKCSYRLILMNQRFFESGIFDSTSLTTYSH